MKPQSFIVAALALLLAWFPVSSFAAATDYDGGWAGTYSCGAVITDPSRPEFSNETKLTIANGSANGEFSRNTKLGKETENWTGSISNGNLNLSNAARREDGATWTLRFNGSVSGSDKISISGEMLGRTGQKVRDCKLVISLTAPSQASLVGKAKTAEENQARQKLATDSEKKRIAADKEVLAAQTRKFEADKTAALREQAQIAEANKLQIEQQAKIVAEKEAELAAEAKKIEDEKAAASEAQAQIAEKERLLIEQQAKLIAEKEEAARESSNNTQLLLFALAGLLVTGFVIFLAVRRKGAADNNKQKEPTAAAVEVKDDTNLAQQVKAENERQELALREQVATLEKEKNALIDKERVAALEAQKETAQYQAKIEKLEQERLSAIDKDKKEREKTSEALRIASAEARISIPLVTPQSPTEKVNSEELKSTSSFCMQCGTKLEDKATACSSCGNPVPFTSSLISKKLVDDAKNKLQNLSTQLQGAVVKAAGDITQEAKKINEARIQAAEQSNFKEAENKRTALVNASLSFWSNLSSKQKGFFIGIPLFFIVCLMAIFENKFSAKDAADILSRYQYEECKLAQVYLNVESAKTQFSSLEESNRYYKEQLSRYTSAVNKLKMKNTDPLGVWAQKRPENLAYVRCMTARANLPCVTSSSDTHAPTNVCSNLYEEALNLD
jgi:DNA repair exonuclease SbcCD ATPase subunit